MSDLGDRMKRYESCFDFHLPRKSSVIVRVDGRAFHTYTRGMAKPFDGLFARDMINAAVAIASEMQGFRLAYVQSDEASFWIDDRERIESEPWFDNSLSKILSLSASAFTVSFGRDNRAAQFDSRAFILPRSEVPNYFLWRAKDWHRNSVQMLARAHFSHKQLNEKSLPEIHDMLEEININWAEQDSQFKNGTFITSGMNECYSVPDRYAEISVLCGQQDEEVEQ